MDAETSAAVTKLLDYGMDPHVVATALDLPTEQVYTLKRTITVLAKEDEELADAVRKLAWRAISVANDMLDLGSPSERLSITRLILSNTAKLIGSTTSSSVEEGRVTMDRIWKELREVIPVTNAEVIATPPRTDDPDQETGNGQVPH